MIINVAFIQMKPTSTGKQRWNVKDEHGKWYSVWDEAIATQLTDAHTNNYPVNVDVKVKGDFSNIQGVLPAGVAKEQLGEEDILAAFRDDPEPVITKPEPSKLTTELNLLVHEREVGITLAVTMAAAGKLDSKQIEPFADSVIRYLQSKPFIEHKNYSDKGGDGLEPERFIK